MRSEGRFAGSGVPPRPAREGQADYSAGPSKTPEIPVIADPALAAAAERASDLDRSWFRRHPLRAHRVRRPVPGEFPFELVNRGPQLQLFVLVKQAAVGARVKTLVWGRRSPCGCETCAADLWERATSDQIKSIALDVSAAVLGARS